MVINSKTTNSGGYINNQNKSKPRLHVNRSRNFARRTVHNKSFYRPDADEASEFRTTSAELPSFFTSPSQPASFISTNRPNNNTLTNTVQLGLCCKFQTVIDPVKFSSFKPLQNLMNYQASGRIQRLSKQSIGSYNIFAWL